MKPDRLLLIAAIFWSSLVLSAHGTSVEISITPTNLDQHGYVFSISTNAAQYGVAFHVAISTKTGEIYSDSSVGLSMVTHPKDGGCSITGVEPAIPITLEKDKRVWKSEFTVSQGLLKKPGLCFIFTELAHVIRGGKSVAMPSATFYEIKLQDFLGVRTNP
jgi:hypothetical protein